MFESLPPWRPEDDTVFGIFPARMFPPEEYLHIAPLAMYNGSAESFCLSVRARIGRRHAVYETGRNPKIFLRR
jgi:hypothetical protein